MLSVGFCLYQPVSCALDPYDQIVTIHFKPIQRQTFGPHVETIACILRKKALHDF